MRVILTQGPRLMEPGVNTYLHDHLVWGWDRPWEVLHWLTTPPPAVTKASPASMANFKRREEYTLLPCICKEKGTLEYTWDGGLRTIFKNCYHQICISETPQVTTTGSEKQKLLIQDKGPLWRWERRLSKLRRYPNFLWAEIPDLLRPLWWGGLQSLERFGHWTGIFQCTTVLHCAGL